MNNTITTEILDGKLIIRAEFNRSVPNLIQLYKRIFYITSEHSINNVLLVANLKGKLNAGEFIEIVDYIVENSPPCINKIAIVELNTFPVKNPQIALDLISKLTRIKIRLFTDVKSAELFLNENIYSAVSQS